jgi:selenocysteine lyase/cysteine desulfurase
VSCVFEGYSSDNIGQILSEQNVAVRTGLHCAPYAHKFIGTFPAGTVRFSVSYFNSDEDFEKLEAALEYIEENS